MITWATIVKLVYSAFEFFRSLLSNIEAERNKQAGRDEANEAALRQNAERNAHAREVEAKAEADQRAHPNDDDGFDTSFRRD